MSIRTLTVVCAFPASVLAVAVEALWLRLEKVKSSNSSAAKLSLLRKTLNCSEISCLNYTSLWITVSDKYVNVLVFRWPVSSCGKHV